MKIAITGHRPNKLGNDYDLKSPLILKIKDKIIDYIKGGILHNELLGVALDLKLITGMALGIDTLFAKIAIEYNIPFIAAVPCENQEKLWLPKSKILYHELLSKASEIIYTWDGNYTNWCMQKRNEWMVDNCDILIAVWDGSNGGTANCVRYAASKGIRQSNGKLIRIDPLTLL